MKKVSFIAACCAAMLLGCAESEAVEKEKTASVQNIEAATAEATTPESPAEEAISVETVQAESGEVADASDAKAEQSVQPVSWTVDASASRLGFSATQNGNRFDGAFENFEAAIVFDPDNLEAASIDVTIDMTSAKTGDKQRDGALPSSDWFKAKNYPAARFVSSAVTQNGEGAYEASGSLTIRDVTKDIVLPFTLDIEDDTAKASGEVALIRTDFGVGQGEFSEGKWVGLEVGVTVDITATR